MNATAATYLLDFGGQPFYLLHTPHLSRQTLKFKILSSSVVKNNIIYMAQKIKALVFYLPVKPQVATTEKATTTAAAETSTGELS